jgi:DNA/RNA endonuclease YhcR with UshA esterase domain
MKTLSRSSLRFASTSLITLVAAGWLAGLPAADTQPAGIATAEQTISAVDALSHVAEECTVEFVVKATRKLDDKNICFLNSEKNHREPTNFTAVIFSTGLARFTADGIKDPAAAFLEKKVRVSGVIEERSGQAQIVIASPAQIKLVDGDEAEPAEAEDR